MLQFNPYFRPSAKELLQHSYFDDIRTPQFEQYQPHRQQFEFDTDACFDLEANDFRTSLTALRKSLYEKVRSFHPIDSEKN